VIQIPSEILSVVPLCHQLSFAVRQFDEEVRTCPLLNEFYHFAKLKLNIKSCFIKNRNSQSHKCVAA